MTSIVILIQRCMVVMAVVLCYFQVRSVDVDCELYPFHHTCRGTMSKKRTMLPNSIYGVECDGSRGDSDCMKSYGERRRIPYASLPKSRFLIALLDNDLQRGNAYNTRHRQRNENEIDGRRTALIENFLSQLEAKDDY